MSEKINEARDEDDTSSLQNKAICNPATDLLLEDCTSIRLVDSNSSNDARIIFQNHNVVSINRHEFAECSPYFRAVFFNGFKESISRAILLDHIEQEAFLRCCAFLHQLLNGNKTSYFQWMTLQIAFEILDLASYLLIDPILEVISDVIVAKVKADSLILAFHQSEYRHITLSRRIWKMIKEQFNKLVSNQAFIALTENEMLKILDDRRSNIDPSEEAFVIQKWISFNGFANAVRLRKRLTDNDGTPVFASRSRIPNSIVIASGGWSVSGPTPVLETFDSCRRRWIRSVVSLQHGRAYHALVNTGDDLYLIGGQNANVHCRSTCRLSLSTMAREEVAAMHDKRCYLSCSVLDSERIIAFGGYNGQERLRSAEVYRTTSNQWSRIANMVLRRSDGHCVVNSGIAYAVGGFDGIDPHSTVEFYNPENNRWILIEKRMNNSRSGVGAAALHGGLFVCGGYDGKNRLRSTEFYDPREGSWYYLRPMNRSRSNYGIELLNDDQVIVAGGYGGAAGTIDYVESYDIRSNSWLDLPSLGMRRSALYLTRIECHPATEFFVTPSTT